MSCSYQVSGQRKDDISSPGIISLLEEVLNCYKVIRKQFLLQDRKVMLSTRHQVLNNKELLSDFSTLVLFRSSATDAATIRGVYFDLVKRVINTMANSFLSSQDMLERISKNKGVDAQMTLRDKLKAYASDTQCKIQL